MVKPGFKITGLKCQECGRRIGRSEDMVPFSDCVASCLDCKSHPNWQRETMALRLKYLNTLAKRTAFAKIA